jgi:hypothetical protein
MIRPMPFCPSFEPWAKLTPVQVRIRTPRIHHGGGPVLFGSLYNSGFRATSFNASSRRPDAQKPMSGESSSE